MPGRNFKNKNNTARIVVGAGRYLAPTPARLGLPALSRDFQPRSSLSQVGVRDARLLSNGPNLRRLVPDNIFFAVTRAERKRVALDLGVVNVARLGVIRHSFGAGGHAARREKLSALSP
jgi:hypothetical protein